MPYGLIVIAAVIWLTLDFVLATEVSRAAKGLVLGVLDVGLAGCFYWHHHALASLFLLVGLGLCLALHRLIAQARSSGRHD
jgi:hypothetical protein